MYELALNPDLQRKLQKEIDDNMVKCKNEITYEGIMGMDLLDRTVDGKHFECGWPL